MIPHILLPLVVGVSIALMLVRPFAIPEVGWVGGGAFLLLVLRLIPPQLAAKAIAEGSDVYLFLIGMMLLSELARENGVFDWLSSLAVRKADGSCVRLFTLVYLIGTVVTIFMSNDATAVVLTPAILIAVRRAEVGPLPHLFACALIANAASFVLPISNPANLVVFHGAMPALVSWLLAFALPSAFSIASTYLVIRVVFRKSLSAPIPKSAEAFALNRNGKLVLIGLAATVVVLLTASAARRDIGLPTCLLALLVTAAVSLKRRANPIQIAKKISWSTIALVAGLFILVDAVESQGVLSFAQRAFHSVQQFAPATGAVLTSFVLAVANNLVNNLPLGLLAGAALQSVHVSRLLASAVLIGIDLGPNLSVTGSLATILWLIALRREKVQVTFWDFLKVGAIAMPVALAAAMAGALLMQAFLTPQ